MTATRDTATSLHTISSLDGDVPDFPFAKADPIVTLRNPVDACGVGE